MNRSLSLAESLAVAVLKGDTAAAYALADELMQEAGADARLRAVAERKGPVHQGYEVYRWPEFRSLCERLGVCLDLSTVALTISLPADGAVSVQQEYLTRAAVAAAHAASR